MGYAYASPWRARASFRHTFETTVYVDPAHQGQGIGTSLYRRLLDDLHVVGCHAAIGAIALPNAASVRLHERLGFRKVGHFPQVGYKLGDWRDVGYWQRVFSAAR